jgi:signal transduction histidine kinase
MLSAVRVGLTTLGKQLPDPHAMDQQKKMLDDTISSVRSISRDLMPSTLERFGLVHALRELCDQVYNTSLLPVTFEGDGEVDNIAPNKQLMIFRIAQELVTNAVKHAHATSIRVHLRIEGQLHLTVEDNGIGFDAEIYRSGKQPGRGLGLFTTGNRVRLLGARLTHEPVIDHGSKITLTMSL